MVFHHPVDAVDDVEHAAPSGARQHAYRHDGDGFGDTVVLSADGACHVGAVAVAVFGAASVIYLCAPRHHTTTKIAMVASHSGVDDVGTNSGTGVVVGVHLVHRQRALVDAVETPRRRAGLVAFDADNGVLFDEHHIGIGG